MPPNEAKFVKSATPSEQSKSDVTDDFEFSMTSARSEARRRRTRRPRAKLPAISHPMPPTKLSSLSQTKLDEYEYYPNWILDSDNGYFSFPEDEVVGVLSTITNELNEFRKGAILGDINEEYQNEFLLRVHGMLPIMNCNALAYLHTFRRNYLQADAYLEDSNRLIHISLERKIFLYDYVMGLFYLIKGLKAILEYKKYLNSVADTSKTDNGINSDFNVDTFVRTHLEPFSELNEKSKIAVWASKYFFLKHRHNKGVSKYKDINQIVELDPDYYEWRLHQYRYLRSQRQKSGVNIAPGNDEIMAIHIAYRAVPENPFCLAYISLCAAEVLRIGIKEITKENPLSFGFLKFVSAVDVIEFVQLNSRRALETNFNCIHINIILANIFGSLLPYYFRDNGFARQCINKAYLVGESMSSRANHRMAIHILTSCKDQGLNPIIAEKCLENAFSLDKNNFHALETLIEIRLSKPEENNAKLLSSFHVQLKNSNWTDEMMSKLRFLQGCFLFMLNDDAVTAIVSWVSAMKLCCFTKEYFLKLRTMSYLYRRFLWPQDRLNLPNILHQISCFKNNQCNTFGPTESDTNLLELEEIIEAVRSALNSDVVWNNRFRLLCPFEGGKSDNTENIAITEEGKQQNKENGTVIRMTDELKSISLI